MKRSYKLAANYNVVELEFTDEDLKGFAKDDEIVLEYDELADDYSMRYEVSDETLIKRLLQYEYDILASINVINPAPTIKNTPPVEKPSPKMIEWATNLGMKNAESKSKGEVWAYIQKHKA